MARKKEVVQIDGHEVEVYQLPIPISLKVMTRLVRILGKPLGSIINGNTEKGTISVNKSLLDSNIDLETIIGHLAENIEEDNVISTIQLFLPYLHIDGKQMKSLESFDDLGLAVLLKTIGEALRVNYSDFFGGLLGEGAKEKIKTES